MTTIETRPAEVVSEQNVDPDRLHITCCDDGDVALCGIDVSAHRWYARGEQEECEPCERIDEAIAEAEDCAGCCPLDLIRALGGVK